MSFVLLNKNGEVATKKTRDLTIENLYKKCGFRSDNHFKRIHIWSVILNDETYLVAIYGKTKGKAGQENKHELPPPLDQDMYYGSMGALRLTSEGEVDNFTKEEWTKVYEALFGGFEDLNKTNEKDDEGEDSELATEDDEGNYDKSMITKTGYLKDEFIVSDEESDSDNEKYKEENKIDDKETGNETEYDGSAEHDDEQVILEDEYTDSELSEEEFTDDEEEFTEDEEEFTDVI